MMIAAILLQAPKPAQAINAAVPAEGLRYCPMCEALHEPNTFCQAYIATSHGGDTSC